MNLNRPVHCPKCWGFTFTAFEGKYGILWLKCVKCGKGFNTHLKPKRKNKAKKRLENNAEET